MADGNLAKSPIKRGSSVPSFSNPEMENSPNLQPGFACTALSDFEGHHLQSPWQQNPETHFSFSGDHADNKRLLPTFFSVGMDSYGNAQFPNMGAPAWDNRGSYSSMVSNAIAGNSPGYMGPEQFHEGPGHMNAGLDYISPRLEHIQAGNAHVNGEALLRKMVSLPQLSPEMDKYFNCSSWAVSATMDPLGEGIKMQGMNPAASHCLANLPADPGFTDRAARFSAFGNVGYSGSHLDNDCAKTLRKTTQTKAIEHHTIPRHSAPRSPLCIDNDNSNNIQESCKFPPKDGSSTVLAENLNMDVDGKVCMPIEGKAGMPKLVQSSVNESDESTGQEVSSSCEKSLGNEASPIRGLTAASRKRKAAQKLKDSGANKTLKPDVTNLKCQQSGDQDPKQSNSGNSEASTPKSAPESSKPPEPLKQDYIHVRARRGQATDSHSLAERVRREKISERMKFLQDLVPGCSKVTGKAVMLDEIINYVQSLQRQVEFLSMKLAAVNPRVDFNIDNLFGRERLQPRPPAFGLDNANMYSSLHPHQQSPMPVQALSQFPPLDIQSLGSDPALRRTLSTPPSVDTCGNSVSVVSQAWDDELQRVVQMTFAPGSGVQTSVDLQGQMFPGQMKAEH